MIKHVVLKVYKNIMVGIIYGDANIFILHLSSTYLIEKFSSLSRKILSN